MQAYKRICIHAYMRTCIHAYVLTCVHAYMHTCAHAHMHTCIHACTLSDSVRVVWCATAVGLGVLLGHGGVARERVNEELEPAPSLGIGKPTYG